MSRATELAYEAAKETKFNFRDNHTIEVMDASILWPDFTGRVTDYHKVLGEKRSFNIVIPDEMLEALRQMEQVNGTKFRIHEFNVYSEQDVQTKGVQQIVGHYINVKVNMDNAFPPVVTLFTEYRGVKSKNTLHRETIGQLDSVDMEHADMVLNIYSSKMHPDFCTAYLKKLNVIQNPQVEFDGRYDDWEDSRGDGEPQNLGNGINPATGEPY